MANYLPASFDSNSYRGGNIVIDLSGNNQNYSELISAYDSAKPAIYLGDGWCTFPDLDNFDSEKLLKAFTLKEKDSSDSIWDPSLTYTDSCQRISLSISALRQLEALFNLSQLLFGLSRAETVNYTFRDLQLRKHPHSFKKSGFKQLNFDLKTDFYAIFAQLVNVIIEEGGLEVTLLMYKNPMLPMVRQKCLDLISNVATVPDVAFKIMRHQSWFLDHLLILVRDGEIVSDKIPALSVLIRLLKVMLTERMISAYMKLVDMQYIDCLVDIFENPAYTDSAEFLPFFIKFEFITMQSLTVILGDSEYSQLWSDKAKTRLLNYCMVVFLKAAGAYPATETTNQINHIFYAEQHTNKHSLAHTIMTVTELLRNDENMKLFYRYHRPFKQLIIQLYKKYGAKSQYIRTDPGISYALNHLMRVLYIKSTQPTASSISSSTTNSIPQGLSVKNQRQESTKNLVNDFDDKREPKICSNPECKNEETKYKKFKSCTNCNGLVAYCSSKCKKAHIGTHMINDCRRDELIYNQKDSDTFDQTNEVIYENFKSIKQKQSLQNIQVPVESTLNQQRTYSRIYNSTSTGNYQKNTNSRRASENLHQKNYQQYFEKLNEIQQQQRRRESSGGRECNYQSNSKTKKLSKFSSMNDNNRRSSLSNEDIIENSKSSNQVTVRTVYAKHTISMKESKSAALRRMAALDEEANFKLRLLNSRDNHQTKSIILNDTTASSIQFHRPLKTSTAMCLPELTRRQSLKDEKLIDNLQVRQTLYKQENVEHQYINHIEAEKLVNNLDPTIIQKNSDSSSSYASNASSSGSTSISSSVNKNPQKKMKLSNGGKSIPKIEKMKESKMRQREKKQSLVDSASISKRRHSETSAILTSSSSSSSSSSTIQTSKIASNKSTTSKEENLNAIEETLFYHGMDNSNPMASEAIKFMKEMENQSSSNDENEEESDENEIDEDDSENDEAYSISDSSTHSSIDQNEISGKDKDEDIAHRVKVHKYKTNDEGDEEEVESERWADNEEAHSIRRKFTNKPIESNGNKFHELAGTNEAQIHMNSNFSVNEINEEEQDRRSQFKVIKEFEKTMEFVKNASNLKVMPSLLIEQPSNEEIDEKQTECNEPQLSLASLCYDESNDIPKSIDTKNQIKMSSEDESDTDSNNSKYSGFTKRPSLRGRNLAKGVNLIINNSIDSHMLTNSYKMKAAVPNAILNRKNTDGNLKKHYQKNFINRCNSIGNNHGTSTPYFSGNKIINDRKTIDDSDGYHGTDANHIYQTNSQDNPNCNQVDEFVDDEMSLFKNKNDTLITNRLSDYKSFKTPLMQSTNSVTNKENTNLGKASVSNLQYSAANNRQTALINSELISHKEKDVHSRNQQSVFIQKHSELKVFNNINTNVTMNSLNQTDMLANQLVKAELPKNSTPISTDLSTQQHLSAKHRHFLNAQLDLTIAPPKNLKKTNSPSEQVFRIPQVPPISEERSTFNPAPSQVENIKKIEKGYKTSTLKSNSNLVINSEANKKKMGNQMLTSDILDVSKISALENATSTNGYVVVAKADMPKDVRKCLKDEFKKDKKQCSIS